jgi:hypothetical protein
MEQKSNSFLFLLNQSALTGIILVCISVVFYLLDMSQSSAENWSIYLVFSALLFWGIQKYRDEVNEGEITYAHALGTGFKISLYASIIVAFYNYIFLTFIDPSFIDVLLTTSYNSYLELGMDEDAAAEAVKQAETFMSPSFLAFSSVISFTIFGTLLSLVVAFFTKRESNTPKIEEEL